MATAETETSHDEQIPPGGLVYDGFISYWHAADDLLAPRWQSGLQRFAKPCWKRRASRIFRDESSLSANQHLWSSITDALDQSGWCAYRNRRVLCCAAARFVDRSPNR